MKIIITETQSKLLWLRRRLDQNENLIKEIVIEGFDYVNVCDNINNPDKYLDEVIGGSIPTFINSFVELYNLEEKDYIVIHNFLYSYLKQNFKKLILRNYDYNLELCYE